MKKYHYALWTVLASVLICLNGCAATAVSGAVESGETYTGASSSPAGYTEHEPEPDTDTVHTVSAEPATSMKDTPIPSLEPASAMSPTITPTAAKTPTPEPANAANSTIAPPVTQIPSPGLATTVNPTSFPEVTPIPSAEPAASPTPTPPAQTGADFIYPIQTFSDKTRICLTFDDGGDGKSVKRALEILKKHEMQCTFFVIGKYLKAHEALWKQAVEEGHVICNHTQNHKYLTELNNEDARKEILEWESTAVEILGQEYLDKMKQEFPFIRLPGGAGNESKRVLRIVSELGYTPIGWNLETYYAVLRHHDLNTEPVTPIADEVLGHVTKRAKGGSIILLHFNAYDTTRLDEIITAIKEKDLTMHLLSECLDY